MSNLLNTVFISIALGHFMIDMLNGSRAVLLTYLGLSATQISQVAVAYVWLASLSQPFFGWLADRHGPRVLTAGGLLWLTGFYSLAMILPGNWALAALVIASLGSGAFHPAGTMQATLQGRHHADQRETTATSLFFMGGQLGLFVAPILTGALLGFFADIRGLLLLPAAALPVIFNMSWQMRHHHVVREKPQTADKAAFSAAALGQKFIIALALLAGLQSWAQQNMINFIPKYLSTLGMSAKGYGFLTGLFMGGSALGNLVGGTLADRFGKRRVAGTALFLASAPLYAIGHTQHQAWLYWLIPLAGAMTGMIHSIVVVIAQKIIPGGMGLASGLILGFIFSAGALGMVLTGWLADRFGYDLIFTISVGLVLIAMLLTLVLPPSVDEPAA